MLDLDRIRLGSRKGKLRAGGTRREVVIDLSWTPADPELFRHPRKRKKLGFGVMCGEQANPPLIVTIPSFAGRELAPRASGSRTLGATLPARIGSPGSGSLMLVVRDVVCRNAAFEP